MHLHLYYPHPFAKYFSRRFQIWTNLPSISPCSSSITLSNLLTTLPNFSPLCLFLPRPSKIPLPNHSPMSFSNAVEAYEDVGQRQCILVFGFVWNLTGSLYEGFSVFHSSDEGQETWRMNVFLVNILECKVYAQISFSVFDVLWWLCYVLKLNLYVCDDVLVMIMLYVTTEFCRYFHVWSMTFEPLCFGSL